MKQNVSQRLINQQRNAPQAAILFDKFHVLKHLGEALDKIRKSEYARLAVPRWLDCHARMYEFFNGVSAITVPDNLRSGITTPDRYEAEINPSYRELAKHYVHANFFNLLKLAQTP